MTNKFQLVTNAPQHSPDAPIGHWSYRLSHVLNHPALSNLNNRPGNEQLAELTKAFEANVWGRLKKTMTDANSLESHTGIQFDDLIPVIEPILFDVYCNFLGGAIKDKARISDNWVHLITTEPYYEAVLDILDRAQYGKFATGSFTETILSVEKILKKIRTPNLVYSNDHQE